MIRIIEALGGGFIIFRESATGTMSPLMVDGRIVWFADRSQATRWLGW